MSRFGRKSREFVSLLLLLAAVLPMKYCCMTSLFTLVVCLLIVQLVFVVSELLMQERICISEWPTLSSLAFGI